ncbi:MAG: branched-chain amino acid ABC transporter permease [Alphaproteobacteria bacterium]|nr:branched-chain amino acid ABC transporter permease [Alphaproteobacteria bacterium]
MTSSPLLKGFGAFADARRMLIAAAIAAVPLLGLPFVVGEYVVHVFTIAAYYVILAASWNLLAGFAGQFSLAQHAFAAMGAYASGLLIYHLKTPLWVSVPAGVLIAAASGYVLGRLVLRMRAIYLSIATWAFAETFRIVLTAAYEFTRGDLGLSVPALYGSVRGVAPYYTFVGCAVACVLLMHLLLRSPLGYFMRALKDDQLRAESLGVDTTRVKLFAFVISSGMAGLAGVLYAHYVLTLTPSIVDFSEMAKIIVMVAIGGLGYFAGPLLAVPPIHYLSSYLQAYGEWSMVVFAGIVIVIMRAYPGGLSAVLLAAKRRLGG